MKKMVAMGLAFSMISVSFAQSKLTAIDTSPMDMAYYPPNFPVLKIQNKLTEPLFARVMYSRPQKNGRMVLGELIEYGKVWRLGANEATEIELFKDASVGTNKLKKGKYTIYALPESEKRWTIIFNKETDTWGSFQYDQKKDVFRYDIKPEKLNEIAEAFTIMWEKNIDKGANLIMAWDDIKCVVPFVF